MLMYSSGMPLLYPIGMFQMIATYWVDKYLCKPLQLFTPFYSPPLLQDPAQVRYRDVERGEERDAAGSLGPYALRVLHVLQLANIHILNEGRIC
jgi:hypothetical protein